jgi:flavin reductase (DIM6/NTAB) family NADH-FMN oxidoreductase RutF
MTETKPKSARAKPAAAAPMVTTPAPNSATPTGTPALSGGIDPREFRNALGSFATGVTIVTTRTADGRNVGLTCNSFASVSLNPPLVLWSLVTHSSSLTAFQECSHFAVNVLGRDQGALAMTFARSGDDKFANVSWTLGLGDAPVLAGCVANFQCRSADRYYGGDHVIFLGAVEAFAHVPDAPLLFSRGTFGAFTPDTTK